MPKSRLCLPVPLTTESANALISRLSDSEVRTLPLDQLNTQATEIKALETSGSEEFLFHAKSGAW